MKRIFILLIVVQYWYTGFSQTNMGTIEVNQNFTATLNFASNIKFITIGNNPQMGVTPNGDPRYKYYDIFQSDSTVVLRGNDPSCPKTSITIKLENGTIYWGLLQYGEDAKIYYDFKGVSKQIKKDSIIHKDKTKGVIINNLNKVLGLDNEYVEGLEENLLEVVVSDIRNDANNTYFKISIKNNSGNDYVIDNTEFKYVEGKNQGLFKKGSIIEEREMIVYQTDNKTVKAYSTSDLGYVIPLFAVGTSSGILKIQFVEKNGTRNPCVEIKSKTMLKVKTL